MTDAARLYILNRLDSPISEPVPRRLRNLSQMASAVVSLVTAEPEGSEPAAGSELAPGPELAEGSEPAAG